jgi:hypothetical protein
MKMACGENPKRYYGSEQGVMPSTRKQLLLCKCDELPH